MVRTKNTARKPSAGLPTARRPYVCQHCRREINDLSNYRRHLAIVHGKKDDGTGADDSTVARFSRYAKRGPRVTVQSAPSADDTSRPQPTTSDEKPTTSALHRQLQHVADDVSQSRSKSWNRHRRRLLSNELPRRPTSPTTWPCQHQRADQRLRPVRPTTCSLILPTKKLPPR